MAKASANFGNVAHFIMTLAVTAQVGVTAWCVREIVHVRVAVARIEVEHVTAEDQLDIWREIGTIREKIARLEP